MTNFFSMKKFNEFLNIVFFISLPLQSFLGELITNITISIYCIIYITFFISQKKIKFSIFNVFFTLFFLFACTSIFYTNYLTGTGYVLRKLIPLYCYGMCMSIYWHTFSLQEERIIFIKKLMYIYLCTIVLICCYLLIFELPILGIWGKLGSKLFKNVGLTVWTYHLCFALNFCIYFILKKFNIDKHVPFKEILFFVILLICSYLSSVRKVILSPILFFSFYMIIMNRENLFKIFKYIFISIVIFSITYYIITSNERLYLVVGQRVESLIANIFDLNISSTFIDYSRIERNKLAENAINLFKEYPIFGYGLDAFKSYTVHYGTNALYSHNNYLELLSCTGIIGFSLYYNSILYLIKRMYANISKESIYICALCILAVQLILDFGSVTYYSNIYIPFYFLLSII